MGTTTLEVKAEVKQLVSYRDTTVSHSYGIYGIKIKHLKELNELISEELYENGYVKLISNELKIYCAVYETTDSDEVDEYTAENIGKAINIAIAKLALNNGGYKNITLY